MSSVAFQERKWKCYNKLRTDAKCSCLETDGPISQKIRGWVSSESLACDLLTGQGSEWKLPIWVPAQCLTNCTILSTLHGIGGLSLLINTLLLPVFSISCWYFVSELFFKSLNSSRSFNIWNRWRRTCFRPLLPPFHWSPRRHLGDVCKLSNFIFAKTSSILKYALSYIPQICTVNLTCTRQC